MLRIAFILISSPAWALPGCIGVGTRLISLSTIRTCLCPDKSVIALDATRFCFALPCIVRWRSPSRTSPTATRASPSRALVLVLVKNNNATSSLTLGLNALT